MEAVCRMATCFGRAHVNPFVGVQFFGLVSLRRCPRLHVACIKPVMFVFWMIFLLG